MTIKPQLQPSVQWHDGTIELIDQRQLPDELVTLSLRTVEDIAAAISTLAVRGAPAIGAAGALGLVVALDQHSPADRTAAAAVLDQAAATLNATRPTAVNLAWALRSVLAAAGTATTVAEMRQAALQRALAIIEADRESSNAIGRYGADELGPRHRILTHCNTGRLATAGIGTALGVLYTKAAAGDPLVVFASETRPLLQGGRLTAWELNDAGIDVRVIPDGASAALLRDQMVDAVIVGADRIAANGDTANKIGTLSHALHAHRFGVPFYVAAPLSTFDLATATGAEIEIEFRGDDELRTFRQRATAPDNVATWNPAFDVTPAEFITAIITEVGVLKAPYTDSIAAAITHHQESAS